MLLKLKEVEKTLEDTLAKLRQTGKISEQIESELNYVLDFAMANLITENAEEGFKIRPELINEYPEGVHYLQDPFPDYLKEMKQILNVDQPDSQNVLYFGTEILQRLKSFSKVSSPSTF
ncbi:hypothetical protein [Natranaerobius thermophilus]|uniref:Uncharacterized protein n=1 Tax=Natranaerobius thermophilus (strain ATCC BAA-1301 / DSM 18059 / JW/NM-WN-LF) TaxID=457570 RepID=B2A6Q6_NATTJ|nr:hypothetical protein [Natranaerobius thermophilus]ACB84189.1 hypothetical protein Nther_0594 [Natranaerobius thermophilus JW/NM-WN-LF]